MRFFVRGDLDGFFGLFVDNLVQLLLIVVLCGSLCGMSGDHAWLLYARILPGAAASVLLGNLFYAWQAHRLARRERRDDVTALPYGINTPSLLVYVFFVIAPVYRRTGDPELAWKMGLLACFGSGLIELAGSLVGESVRRRTPRAALLATLAGIAIGFIAMTFALRIWAYPLIAMAPLAIVLITYFSRARFPLGLPGGFVAVLVGTALAWLVPAEWSSKSMGFAGVRDAAATAGVYLPAWCGGALLDVFRLPMKEWLGFVSVIIPMGLFNVIGSLQNIESAEADGDLYETRASLAVNGFGTVVAVLCGSCFPTTIYIGHPGWKRLGARAGYSILNGLAVTVLCLTGTVGLVSAIVPIEAGMAIVLWIGLVITAQAFQATPREHAPAVALGLFPAIAAWGATVAYGAIETSESTTIQQLLQKNHTVELSGFVLHGMLVLERGYIFTCMVMAGAAASLVDGKLLRAALWCVIGAGLTLLGVMHSYAVSGNTVDFLLIGGSPPPQAIAYRAFDISLGYLSAAIVFAVVHVCALHDRAGE